MRRSLLDGSTKCRAALRWVLIACLLLGQQACLHSSAQQAVQIPRFESIALVNKGATDELKKRFDSPQEGSSVDPAMLAGAGAGAGAAVAAQASLACPYLVFVCALVLVPAGALVGAIGGSAADSADQPLKGLSREQVLALERHFAALSQERTIAAEIQENLERRIPAGRIVDTSRADALLQFRLYDVRFTKTGFRKYVLSLKSVMLIKWGRDGPRPTSTHRIYRYTSRSMPIDDWIGDDGETMGRAFDACIRGLADEMLQDIQFESP